MKLHRCTHFMKIRFNEDYLQAILDYENNVIEKKDLCDKNINMKLIINKIFKLKLLIQSLLISAIYYHITYQIYYCLLIF